MKKKIVVVDDEPMMVKALKRLFENQSLDFYGFDSPHRALEQMDKIAPQVVLSDQRMPEMEGIHFLEMVRKKWPDTVRMILTGYYVPDSAYQSISLGDVSAIMTKPWNDNQLIQAIDNAFRYSGSMRISKISQCEICGEKGSSQQIQIHHSFYMCARCRNCYELLPGVIVRSLRKLLLCNLR
jgi:DNA-binding NtrC family response regulator